MAEAAKEEKKEKPKNTAMLLQLVFALINLGVMGYGSFLVYKSTIGWKNPAITEEQLEEKHEASLASGEADTSPFVYTMDKLTVNLGGEPKLSIRLEINLEMLGQEGFEEIMEPSNRARARDSIVRLLNEKQFSELETIQGKLFLKNRIAGEINGLLKEGVVKDVYFSDFVVQ